MEDCCSNGVVHLEEGQAAEMWSERGDRSLKTILGLIFSRIFNFGLFVGAKTRYQLISQEGFFCR